jgi:hypothetical protein
MSRVLSAGGRPVRMVTRSGVGLGPEEARATTRRKPGRCGPGEAD